jgi:hypothetical protein
MPEKQTKIDHKAEAQAILKNVGEEPIEEVHPYVLLEAIAHSNLAIAEGQERVAEKLDLLLSVVEEGRLR